MINFIAWDIGVAWYMLPLLAVDPAARECSLSVAQRLAAPAARYPRPERASSCCSYTEPAVHNIDCSIEQAAGTVPASEDSLADTNSSSVDRSRTRIVQLPLSPIAQKQFLHSLV